MNLICNWSCCKLHMRHLGHVFGVRYTPFIERAVASLAYFKDLDMAASVENSGYDSYWFIQLVKSYSCQMMSGDITPKANLITGKTSTQTDPSMELGVFAGEWISSLHTNHRFVVAAQGYNIREKLAFPSINRWFDAMETRSSYRATKSDYYTHAHDLPPQLGGCQAESGA